MERVRSAPAESGTPPPRAAIDWRYTVFYSFFFVCLVLIALFGVIAET